MSSLGDRMKQYENVWKQKLPRRTPFVIRIDGKAFHTYTKVFDDIFSQKLHSAMCITARYLCKNIQGCRLAYTQSDEISLLLTDYERFNTEAWFDKEIQKIVSVSASYATAKFNDVMRDYDIDYLAQFDSRVFSLSKDEVCNYFIWRQQDAVRNSVRMLGRKYFSHSKLQNKSNSEVQDILMEEHNINWNDLATWKKRGSCVRKVNQLTKDFTTGEEKYVKEFQLDNNIPIFTRDREYINDRVYIAKEK